MFPTRWSKSFRATPVWSTRWCGANIKELSMPTAVIEPKMQTRRAACRAGRCCVVSARCLRWSAGRLSACSAALLCRECLALQRLVFCICCCRAGHWRIGWHPKAAVPADGGGIRLCFYWLEPTAWPRGWAFPGCSGCCRRCWLRYGFSGKSSRHCRVCAAAHKHCCARWIAAWAYSGRCYAFCTRCASARSTLLRCRQARCT